MLVVAEATEILEPPEGLGVVAMVEHTMVAEVPLELLEQPIPAVEAAEAAGIVLPHLQGNLEEPAAPASSS